MNATQEQLKLKLEQALVAAFGDEYAGVDPILVTASNPKFGDYQANVALSLSKRLGQQPRAIASAIVEKLDISDFCETPEIAGPGFINLKLKIAYLEAQINAIQTDSRLGVPKTEAPKREIVDFSSPNIAKEMHVGHLRSTIIGDSIARILEFQGHDVLRLNHVGDWGTQFGMLITYLREVYPEALTTANALDIGDLVSFYRKAKQRFDEDEAFQETARQEVVRLQAGAEDTLHAWKLLCEQSRREFQIIYDLLDVQVIERGESFYNPQLPSVVADLAKSGLLVENQGAQVVFLEGFTNREGEPMPLIVQKSDGGYNYATTDLAALRYRIQQDEAKRIIYVTDSGQSNHFAQFFQVARKAGWVPDDVELVHVPFGLVLGEDGKKFKTRSGDTVRLRDLLDEAVIRARADLEARLKEEEREESEEFISEVAEIVGISAVKYADLSQNRTSDYIFSYDKMLDLKGNTAPYMLYAYARIQGISRKGGINFAELGENVKVLLQHDTELALAKYLLQLDGVISSVEQELLPNRLCEYLYELSKKFNQFYDRNQGVRVLEAEEPLRTSRLVLCDLTARTLRLGLDLLGIRVLERM
ncbi:arginine--tRNA ligase [Nodularia spumigena CS-586/05]|uniref:arginine--tRNA ligase n=1 Tax=Nodularia spumigena TaxID=70799 RepID=UPI002330FB24|nr:arginine--tRNA ligase [Nodularia spumigena]MDB9320392.1 arginine--tRNA ligase [Nodularia spumigena CS-591/07A]MDB9330513.1 arginine--tRNA ligase [Nodularia spumigena CS-591/04]MDB9345500.1 arginine--tRNA ligase [Nodularia spumigena CS-588/06]MDB9360084.1 arginine--tRNA ligase [Nodularia spumigena CS-588/02]MDB9366430.1 arginine--tRNA ligase [Nodularia spumigena CS-588/02A10]